MQTNSITEITLDRLVPYSNNPFPIYDEDRFLDMVESIRYAGIITPIIVRPHPRLENNYEILSGRNRVIAAIAPIMTSVIINSTKVKPLRFLFIELYLFLLAVPNIFIIQN